jgi:hypothetical protein
MRLLSAGLLGSLLLVVITQAQEASSAPTEFAVLRTERVTTPDGEITHLDCSIVGSGDSAQLSCESQTSGSASDDSTAAGVGAGAIAKLAARLHVYHVALVVGSNHVGYVVSCEGGHIFTRCQPLSTGQVLKGSVHGDKLTVTVDSKPRNYTVETSAYIGPLTTKSPKNDSTASPPVEQPSTEPTVKLAVEKSGKTESGPSGQGDQSESPTNTAKVMFLSDPEGADIYIDGTFAGNTPSQIQLGAGSHTVRIEAKGQEPWSRTVTLTAGDKVTLHASLGAQ